MTATILFSLCFGWWAFILASNFFERVWQWALAGSIVLAVTAIATANEAYTVTLIVGGILILLTIILLIGKHIQ